MTYFPDSYVNLDPSKFKVAFKKSTQLVSINRYVENIKVDKCRIQTGPTSKVILGSLYFLSKNSGTLKIFIPVTSLPSISMYKSAVGTINGWCTSDNFGLNGFVGKTNEHLIFQFKLKKRRGYKFHYNITFFD